MQLVTLRQLGFWIEAETWQQSGVSVAKTLLWPRTVHSLMICRRAVSNMETQAGCNGIGRAAT